MSIGKRLVLATLTAMSGNVPEALRHLEHLQQGDVARLNLDLVAVREFGQFQMAEALSRAVGRLLLPDSAGEEKGTFWFSSQK